LGEKREIAIVNVHKVTLHGKWGNGYDMGT
jgi:hypothetical protein